MLFTVKMEILPTDLSQLLSEIDLTNTAQLY